MEQNRIVYSPSALEILSDIESYLYHNNILSLESSCQYVEDMKRGFEQSMLISFPSQYEYHKRHGKYVASYRRNPRTRWYAIYDILFRYKYIKHIMNNHTTVKGI